MLIKIGADIPPLVTPAIPAWSTSHLVCKTLLHTDTVIVFFVLLTWVTWKVQLKMLNDRDPVVGIHSLVGDNPDGSGRYAPLVFIYDEEPLHEGFVKNWISKRKRLLQVFSAESYSLFKT